MVVQQARRWIALWGSIVLIAAACGTNQGQQGSAAPSATGAASAGGGPSADGASGPAGELTGELSVWAMGLEGERLSVLADMFMEQNAGVTVDVEPVDWGIARDKLLTAIGGNQTPDVSQMGTDMMGEFVETGAIEAVPTDRFTPEGYFETAWNTGVVDGTAYGVPWYVETRALYHRTDLAGAEAPADWDALMAKAQELKGAGADWGIALGTTNPQEYLPFLWSNGGDIMADDGTFTLNSPEAVEALTFYDSFFEEGLAPTEVPEGFDITPAFVQGTHPMFFSGPWHLGLIDETGGEELADKWTVSPLPQKESATSWIGGSNLVVYQNSQNKELAWAFVEFLTQPETQLAWYQEVSTLPSRVDAWEDPALTEDERLGVFRQQLDDTDAPPAIPTWAQVNAAIGENMEKVTVGDSDPQAGAEAMQQAAEAVGTGN